MREMTGTGLATGPLKTATLRRELNSMTDQVLISIIVPVYNGHKVLPRCLEALRGSTYQSYELIVVDDSSTDDSAEIARNMGASVYQMAAQSGPAAARNLGARNARGEILFFVDADVVVQPDSVSRIAADFQEHPEVAAVFGSYDAEPAEANFVSQYKNLYHHFVHQAGQLDATTFWAGCGGIRRAAFESVGGFDQVRYARPCIEDIELGYRLRRKGHRMLLDKQLQCKHLKQWTFKSLLRADIFHRAIPWSQLILEHKEVINDLNLQTKERVSAVLVALTFALLPLSILKPQLLAAALSCLLIIFVLNHKLYASFLKQRGALFMVLAFLMQLLHYSYSSASFALCSVQHLFNGNTRKAESMARF